MEFNEALKSVNALLFAFRGLQKLGEALESGIQANMLVMGLEQRQKTLADQMGKDEKKIANLKQTLAGLEGEYQATLAKQEEGLTEARAKILADIEATADVERVRTSEEINALKLELDSILADTKDAVKRRTQAKKELTALQAEHEKLLAEYNAIKAKFL